MGENTEMIIWTFLLNNKHLYFQSHYNRKYNVYTQQLLQSRI